MDLPSGLVYDTPEHTISTLATCFISDAFQRYLVFDHLELPDTQPFDVETNKRAFSDFIPALSSEGAVLVTLPGSGIVSVWYVTTLDIRISEYLIDNVNRHLEDFPASPPPEDSHAPRVLAELERKVYPARRKVITPPRQVLHLLLIANDRKAAAEGKDVSIRELVKPMLAMAKEKGWVVALEATSARARDVYQHLGFEVLEEVKVGVGEVDVDGRRVEGGRGVSMWAMVFGV
jgi:hypothetical protein